MPDKEKSEEKRIAEKEKIEAETQRSLAVAEMKQAHKRIEDVEKIRKRSAISSLCKRIDNFSQKCSGIGRMLIKPAFGNNPFYDEPLRKSLLFEYKIYESIYFDIQKTLEINEETMKNLFPKIDPQESKTGYEMAGFFSCMITQIDHMRIYCERFLT